MANNGASQLSPTNLIAACAVLIMAFGAGGAIVQSQFANVTRTQETAEADTKDRDQMLLDRIKILEMSVQKQAREPVEKATVDAINDAIDKRIDLIQSQITDINRQIAAALIIIDNNSGAPKKISPVGPP